ncbi:MAG TPA: HAMP domain-containing sensor histidine kinase [Acidimicrobiales bacterium]|nr:HAMP domain-containing sensor histidine kinase [Acidimicrobiales bacterium]
MAARVSRISFRARLGILVAAAVGVTVALASLASYLAVSHQLFSQVDSALKSELSNAPGPSADCAPGQTCLNPLTVGRFLSRYGGGSLQVVDGQQHVWYPAAGEGPTFPVNQAEAAMASTNRYNILTVKYGGQKYRVITEGGFAATDAFGNQVPVAVQIFRPLSDIEHTLTDLRLILWLVTIGGVVIAVGLGYLIGKTTMRPVVRLTAAAEHVAATQDLDAKIEEQGDDELARLARSFNSMLAALALSREQQRQLISDAGHELRTPLTSLRTNIEVLMRVRDLPEEDRAELMADVNAQLEELTTLIGDVVDVAREDERHTDPIEFRLDNVVDHAIERARRRAPTVTFEARITPGSVRGHPALVERAVLNVLDNAAKWSPQGGVVTVWLQRLDRWTLDVRDQGPGIDAADLPHVFERFYRAESARSMSGSGLGLAIVRKVITDHGGSVTASCPPGGGTLIHIELPTVDEQELDAVGGDVAAAAAPVGESQAEPQAEPTDLVNPYGDPAQPKSEGQSGPVHVS